MTSYGKGDELVVALAAAGTPTDLTSYEGNVACKIDAAIKSTGVLVVGKTWCPFCIEARRNLDWLGIVYSVFNVDDAGALGSEVHAHLKAAHKQTTVPYIFIGGELLGGCSDLNAALADGTLEPKLRAAGCPPRTSLKQRKAASLAVLEGKKRIPSVFFNFPEAVDDHVARFTSFFIFVTVLLCCIYYTTDGAHWVMVGVMVDYCLRILGGAPFSPIGAFAILWVSVFESFGLKPKWIAGPPKQFAALCGLFFSACSSLFFLLESNNEKFNIVGLSFACALGGAALLEGVLGFCLGCVFFGLMVQFGLLPKNVYGIFTHITPEVEYTYEEMNRRLNEPAPKKHVFNLLNKEVPLTIDFKYTDKTDDHTKEDFNVIKHVKITHSLAYMGYAGAACAWKVASMYGVLAAVPYQVYYASGIFAAVVYWIWAVMYVIKMCMYPKKVHKEWMCNVRGNAFVVPLITLVLFAFLVYDAGQPDRYNNPLAELRPKASVRDNYEQAQNCLILGKVLFWLGAPTSLFISLWRFGAWIADRKDLEHVNAGWMIGPVGNFVAALIGPLIDPSYLDAMQFWFAFAFISWLLIFSITFYKAVLKKDDDDRYRPLTAIWVAAPAVMAAAYLMLYLPNWQLMMPAEQQLVTGGSATTPDFNDFIFINLNWFSVAIGLVLMVAAYLPYFGRMKFDMFYWAAGFPTAALSIVTLLYHALKPGQLSYAIAVTCLAITSATHITFGLLTVAGIVRRRIFVPDAKWGPLSFNRLTHEAFRSALPRLVALARSVAEAGTGADAGLLEELADSWRMLKMVHDEHSVHEDQVFFPLYDSMFPGVSARFTADHEGHHNDSVPKIDAAIAAAKTGATDGLVALLEAFAKDLEEHLRGEEDHLQALPRKYVNLALAKDMVRKCWDLTPTARWAEYLPWAMDNLPMLGQRVRFIKTLLWAMPERGQHIGILLAQSIDEVTWFRITCELPEIIPRGAHGWERYF